MKVNDVLSNFISYVYETKSYHPRTWEISCPLPWGESGYKQWDLSSTEARGLRSILIQRVLSGQQPLFDYNTELRCWHLDLYVYPHVAMALQWLEERGITQREWDGAMMQIRDATRGRVEKLRQKV
jgi:hypothetical protein